MSTSITLNKMRFFARHGVAEQERIVGNWFEVSLTIHCDMRRAIENDDLNGTINYAEVHNLIKTEMDTPSALLEHVAGRIVGAITSHYAGKVTGGTVTVAKPHPPLKCQLESVAVTIDF